MELLCPAGNIAAVKKAIENGADAVYMGFNNQTNARRFPGLNFTDSLLEQAVKLLHKNNRKAHLALNTFAKTDCFSAWTQSIDKAIAMNVDVLILSDIALLDYVAKKYPQQTVHLSVQASSTNVASIRFYQKRFGIKRVVLPRVLSFKQIALLANECDVELEVFAYGSLCIMAEGRCYLSSYLTGESPNNSGACSPAEFVEWKRTDERLETRLNGVLIDTFAPEENAGYPTLCKGRFSIHGKHKHVMEEPTSLNTLELLPDLYSLGISAVKIEGRQRSSAYVAQVTNVWREAINALSNTSFDVHEEWNRVLASLSEGRQCTLGAYERSWQ